MAIEVKKVVTAADLRLFIRFNYELYKGNPYAVPDLYEDIKDTFSKDKNPAFEFCEADYFLAYKEGKLVGRVAALINKRANATWDKQAVRFGWIDFIDDREVSAALIKAVKEWGAARGMTQIEGPLGFTDFDAEGLLIEGFEELSTIATIYNYPYYADHLEALGLKKAVDWVERKIYIPDAVPEKHKRIAKIVSEKYGLKLVKFRNRKEITQTGAAGEIFELLNKTYAPLYGFSELSPKQIEHYVKLYIPLLDLRMVTCVRNAEGELIAAAISMPSLSRAMQKAKGRLFPFGWFHLLKALKFQRPKVLDLLLIAVRTDYQGKGVNALIFKDLIEAYQEMGFEYAESNPELETNEKVQNQWQYFEVEQHKRRRCYEGEI